MGLDRERDYYNVLMPMGRVPLDRNFHQATAEGLRPKEGSVPGSGDERVATPFHV